MICGDFAHKVPTQSRLENVNAFCGQNHQTILKDTAKAYLTFPVIKIRQSFTNMGKTEF